MKAILEKVRRYWVKIVLYVLLISFVTFTLFWMLRTNSPLSENFFAGSIEIMVTVFLIDGLLSIDRQRRMRVLNEAHSNSIKTIMSIGVLGITSAFGFKYSDNIEVTEYTNVQLREFVNTFFSDSRYIKFINDLGNMDKRLRPILRKLDKRIENEFKGMRQSLKEVKPYVDPTIMRQIDDFQSKIIAQFTIVNFMYEMIYVHLPAKGHGDPKNDKDFWPFFKDHMYEDLVITGEGKPDNESLETVIKGMFTLLLDIHAKAENNTLHYDI